MSIPMIKTEKLSHTYEDENGDLVYAVKDVSLTVEEGEFVAVIGTNGSGKSTLAKHFNALLLPTSGVCEIDGMRTDNADLIWDIRRRVGMVFQNPDNQIVAAVVEEDAAFGPENLGVPSAEIRERVDKALAAVGMTAFVKHAPHLLSGGQKQRIAIAGILGGSAINAILALVVVSWAKYARMTRSAVIKLRHNDFIAAARVNGTKQMTILWRHILPNVLPLIVITGAMDIGTMMMEVAGLSFLGFGAQPPTPEWGLMLNENRQYMLSSPELMLYPGVAIFIVVTIFNLWGDSLRDILDPRSTDSH